MHGQKQLFEFMLARIKEVATESGLKPPQAFGKWFANVYFSDPHLFFAATEAVMGKSIHFFKSQMGKRFNIMC